MEHLSSLTFSVVISIVVHEVITIPPRTLFWNELFDLLWDWAATRTHREDQEYDGVFNLIEYMSDFLRPPLVRQ